MTRTINLGGGQVVPYPEPSSPEATAIGKANRRTDTKPEVALRGALHSLGLRFRKDLPLRAGGVRSRADIVFTRARVAVYVDGCFWHVCPDHFHMPKSNLDYWKPKLAANVARDRRVTAALGADGWVVLRAWEHEDVELVVEVVLRALRGAGHGRADMLLGSGGTTVRPPAYPRQ